MEKVIKLGIFSLFVLALFIIPAASIAGSWNGWVYQNPYPTSNTLLAVKFITPKKGWIAGEHGTILYTEDGGENWEPQESGTEQDLLGIAFVNEKQGWAVGNGGIIIHTDNSGKQWKKQKEVEAPLHTIFFLNEKEGWAGGGMGQFLHTSDAGKTWIKQEIGATSDIAGIYFLNSNTGWVLSGGAVYRTKDGGKTWEAGVLPAVMIGRTYTGPAFSGPRDFGWQGSVYFSNEKKGWATVGIWYIFSTEDGGKTWQANQVSNSVDRISFTDEKNGCMAGTSILCTEDGGKTWKERLGVRPNEQDIVQGVMVSIWGLSFAGDKLTGWATGNDGQLWKTEDGGKNWKMKSRINQSSVYFFDSKSGWCVKHSSPKKSYIMATTDSGNTWKVQKELTGDTNIRFFFINPQEGWAAGREWEQTNSGPIIHNYFIFYTNDGGKTWLTQFKEPGGEMDISNYFQDVFFINSDTGWAVGQNGLILHTIDGGRHWEHQQSGTKLALWRVQFVNSKEGWVIGCASEGPAVAIILHTVDGGKHWYRQWKKEKEWIAARDLFFANKEIGWAIGEISEYGGDGIIVSTIDGGKTWSEKEFHGIYFDKTFRLDKDRGIILTEKGQMLITRNGGKTWDKQRTLIRRYPWHVSELFKK